ncbi:MAG: hypothetical protein QOD75_658 [Blastocatellia bacterium]|jgi:hypothetical protein|nr:hypothetical protein [Blastocatellia bacterium]
MKHVRQFCAVALFITALSFPALAGDIHGPSTNDPILPDTQPLVVAPVTGSSDVNSTTDDAITALTIRLCEQLLFMF